jgi:hypothetical protein
MDDTSSLEPLMLDKLLLQVEGGHTAVVGWSRLRAVSMGLQQELIQRHSSHVCRATTCPSQDLQTCVTCMSASQQAVIPACSHPSPRHLQISTLASVYHKPADSFVSRQRLAVTKADDLSARKFDEDGEGEKLG